MFKYHSYEFNYVVHYITLLNERYFYLIISWGVMLNGNNNVRLL